MREFNLPPVLSQNVPVWNELLSRALDQLFEELLAALRKLDGGQDSDELLFEQVMPQRSQILTDWDFELNRQWQLAQTRSSERTGRLDWNAESMQLVDTAEMEEEVRVKSLALRIRHQLADRLPRWRDALVLVWGWKQWPDVALPYEPEQLILAIRRLLKRSTNMDPPQRIRWLQAFAANVLERIPELLDQALAQLNSEGFGPASTEVAAAGPAAVMLHLPVALEQIAQQTQPSLLGLVQAYFQSVPSSFYEFLHTHPDDEVRVLGMLPTIQERLSRVEFTFLELYQNAYRELLKPKVVILGSADLLDEETMEWRLCLQGAAQRCRAAESSSLEALFQRFRHVLPKTTLHERAMPLDPENLLNSFDQVISQWPFGVEDKRFQLERFERMVLADIGLVIEEANRIFVEAGVLPELPQKRILKAQDRGVRKRPSASTAQNAGKGEALEAKELGLLRGLLRQQGSGAFQSLQLNGKTIGASVEAVSLTPEHIPEGAVVTPLEQRDLLQRLSQLQEQTSLKSITEDGRIATAEEVRGQLKSELRRDEIEVETLRRNDEDVINLVSMMFDFILDDEALPTPMKALLGRLQIPLLKVAMIEPHFFDAEEYPARSLLNLLAKAGMGWSQQAEGAEELYQQIELTVFRIVRDFSDDLQIFADLLQNFQEYYQRHTQRQDLVEKRTREMEEGRARSEVARGMAAQTINRRLQGVALPALVVGLIRDGWQQLLFLTCLRQGVDSDAWKQAVKVLDALIWSVQERQDAAWKERLQSVRDRIVLNVRRGLASTSIEAAQIETWIKGLKELHEQILQTQHVDRITVVVGDASTVVPSTQVVLPQAHMPEAAVEIGVDADQVTRLVESMPIGAWIERLDQDPVDRCKLVARIRIIDRMIFTNRRGIKVLEVSSRIIVEKARTGQWRLLDRSEQLFDRALESILEGLRRRKEGTPA